MLKKWFWRVVNDTSTVTLTGGSFTVSPPTVGACPIPGEGWSILRDPRSFPTLKQRWSLFGFNIFLFCWAHPLQLMPRSASPACHPPKDWSTAQGWRFSTWSCLGRRTHLLCSLMNIYLGVSGTVMFLFSSCGHFLYPYNCSSFLKF